MKTGILCLFLLLNAVAIFCALNPWVSDWQAQGIMVLVFEVVFIILIGLPVLSYQMIWKKKSFTRSLADSTNAVLDFITNLL